MADIDGGSFDDDLAGTTGADRIRGFAGDDQIAPNGGGDTVFGGEGFDVVTFNTPEFTATFGTSITLNLANPVGRSINIAGSTFDGVELFIFPGNTVFETAGSATNASLLGDVFSSSTVTGHGVDNTFFGSSGDDTLLGLGGDDRLQDGGGANRLEGGDGNDELFINPFLPLTEVSTFFGGAGNDSLEGGALSFGGAGDDSIAFQNPLSGGTVVELFGGTGRDDLLIAGQVDASLFGGGGNDRLDAQGADGTVVLDGGGGNDFYVLGKADLVMESLAFSQGGGIDTVRVFFDNYVQPNNVELVRITGIDGTDDFSATGNDAPGTLVGNAGANTLTARGGNDQVNGNGGDDTLIGNTGRDTLVGGQGADTFVYTAIADSRAGATNRDFINGFDRGSDVIDLSAIDANTTTFGVDDAFEFIGTQRFGGQGATSAGELRLQGLGGPNAVLVEGDHNGDGVADFQILVNLTTELGTTDFIL